MEYPTPEPGPCRRCGTRIWHGGSLCSDCRKDDVIARAKQDENTKKLKRLEAENKRLKKTLTPLPESE